MESVVAEPVPADGHVHTEWSWDAPTGSMRRSCVRARELGLPAVVFADHADFTPWTTAPDGRRRVVGGHAASGLLDVEGYLDEVRWCREHFPDLRILTGVELGEPHLFPAEVSRVLREGGFDRIVGSVHCLPEGDELVYSPLLMDGDPLAVVRRHLAETARMVVECDVFEVLAHLDLPVLFWPPDRPPFDPYSLRDEYAAVLEPLAGGGRVLEVNTAGPWPAPPVLRWWRDHGGTAVSFGSDAHDPADLGRGFPAAMAWARASGFRPGRAPADHWVRD
ncbi:PHP domain-containing protein [Catellatospora tritici]|uniref:PHP domain-containing protein n=1 Tax=Catellatospora tritici TaxID=2851566 RepID=UPI0020C539F7|nr:PHP domain-containing protein [Catellatospora tritici]